MSDFCVVVQNFSCSNYLSTIYIDSFFFFINQWISHQAGDYGRGTIVISKIHLSLYLLKGNILCYIKNANDEENPCL